MDEKQKSIIFTLICIAGFALIFFFVPRIVKLIALKLGFRGSRAAGLIFMAIGFYFWGEICVRIKQKMGVE